jgi:UDP-N-acetylmuramate dehydrogenase
MKLNIQKNTLLSKLSTFGIGGPAKYYVDVRTESEMAQALRFAKEEKNSYFILGKGSNTLFHDQGFDGLIIHNKIDFFKTPEPGVFHIGAGYSFSLLGVQTARNQFGGLEFASGIPASVGGAIFMNAGANGNETSQTLQSVDYVDEDGIFHLLKKEDLFFAYRTSSFQSIRGAIVGATFALKETAQAKPLQLEIIYYRKKTQPYGEKSAGCVFRNPSCGHAGALIDNAGLKGFSVGGAKVSEKHANFIVNTSDAKCEDVLKLIEIIKEKVKASAGVELESEVRVIPFQKEC